MACVEFRPAAGGVDVLDAHDESAAGGPAGVMRGVMGEDGGKGVASMEEAGGGGGEAGDQTWIVQAGSAMRSGRSLVPGVAGVDAQVIENGAD